MTEPSSMFSTMAVVGMLLRGKIKTDYVCANSANNMGQIFFKAIWVIYYYRTIYYTYL
jgi:hypothetical protein